MFGFPDFLGIQKVDSSCICQRVIRGNNDKSEKGIKECYKELCIAPMILLGSAGRGRGKQREEETST